MELRSSRAAVHLIAVALASVSVGSSWPGFAEPLGSAGVAGQAASEDLGANPAPPDAAEAMMLVREAVGDLRQAALQRYVASPEREHALLERVRQDLKRAALGLTATRRDQVQRLLVDLDAAAHRPVAQLGRFDSPFQEPFDPPLPGRNELAILAKQGGAILGEQAPVRPPNTDDIAWRRQRAGPSERAPDGSRQLPALADWPDSVPGESAAWPQLKLRLGR